MSLSGLIEQHVLARPEATAVTHPAGGGDEVSLSYRELSLAANRLAAHLGAHGVRPGDRVVTALRPGPDLVTAFLAIVRAGAAYVPVDPAHPGERRRLIVRDSTARAVVTEGAFAADYADLGAVVVAVDTDATSISERPSALTALTAPVAGPEDAAYVCYTSGTSGAPKGVVVPHRAVLDLVASGDFLHLGPEDVVAQAASPAFDAVTFEIWSTLAAGARLAGLARDTVTDPARFEHAIRDQGVTVAFLTTPLFHRIARERPAAFAPLRALLFGGEPCDPRRVREVFRAGPPNRLLHMYGPTEATTFATWHEVGEPAEDARTIPIGRPLGATVAVVVGRDGTRVAPGGSGELLLGGPGLATGYLTQGDPGPQGRLTAERFVEDRFTTGGGTLYHTGDLVRLREDGALEVLGRVDKQVTLRGHRIELGEIEAVLGAHPAVCESVVSVHEGGDGERRLVAHVVPAPLAPPPAAPAEQVTAWREIFQTLHQDARSGGLGENFAGWDSSYDALPLPLTQMRAWRAATLERIGEIAAPRTPAPGARTAATTPATTTAATPNRRILEIGVGTGLLMAPLARSAQCEEYWATDFSPAVIDSLCTQTRADGRLRGKVRLSCREAEDTAGLPTGHFDTVVINSVVQYLPGVDRLRTLVGRVLPLLAPGGSLLLGDVRHLGLARRMQTGVELARRAADPGAEAAAVLRAIGQRVAVETELLLDPGLFKALAREFPAIRSVDVRAKRGADHNELSRYRYDVVLSTAEPVADLAGAPALPWGGEVGATAGLRAYLTAHRPAALRLTGIPNARLYGEDAALRTLEEGAQGAGTLARALDRLAEQGPAPDPEELCAAAESLGYRALPTWSAERAEALDLVLVDPERIPYGPLDSVYAGPATAVPDSGANTPTAFDHGVDVEVVLRAHLQERLPHYMVPSALVVLDALPLTPSGKLDRAALPVPEFSGERPGTQPGTPVQEIVRDLFAEVLGLPRRAVSADCDFFALGGHSLGAARLLARARQALGVDPGPRALYDAPTPALFAELVGDSPASATGPGGSTAESAVLPLRLRGALSVRALEEALRDLGGRHEALRNSRLGSAGTRLRALAADDHVLELTLPGESVDLWSHTPLAAELALAYGARATGDAPRWPTPAPRGAPRAMYGDLAPTSAPGSGPDRADSSLGSLVSELAPALHEQLARLAAEQGATLFMVVHAGLAALLTRLGARSPVTLAAPVPARDSAALRGAVGPYGRVLALSVDTSGDPAFTELLDRVRTADLAAYRQGDAALALPGGVALSLLQETGGEFEGAGLTVSPENPQLPHRQAALGLTLTEQHTPAGAPAGLGLSASFQHDAIGETAAGYLTGQLVSLLEAAAEAPHSALSGLRLLPGEVSAETLGLWFGQHLELPVRSVASLFAAQVARTPGAPALSGAATGGTPGLTDLTGPAPLTGPAGLAGLTGPTGLDGVTGFPGAIGMSGAPGMDYAELDARSDLLAHALIAHQAGPGTTVVTAIASPTGFAVAVLAIAKTGAACLPVDPVRGLPGAVWPVVLLLDEAADRLLPAVPRAARLVRDPAADLLPADGKWPVRSADRTSPLDPDAPVVLASTAHATVAIGTQPSAAASLGHGSGADAAWLVTGYPDADAALGLLGAFVSGARVNVPDPELAHLGTPYEVLGWLREHGASAVLGAADDSLVALARAEGTALTFSAGWAEGRLLIEQGADGRTRPAPGYRAYVLDARLRPVATGSTGSLYVAGVGVAQGYAGLPGGSGASFLPDPLGGAPRGSTARRMWRTGHAARVEADGSLHILDHPWADDPFADEFATFVVLGDTAGHRALWPAGAPVPQGWHQTHAEDVYELCLEHLGEPAFGIGERGGLSDSNGLADPGSG
ncbi:non-ribosomal peptide synthetase [Streptomyces sp. G-G2]|uniref:non-ribosomal peptide synthetase n=1 Tax=Streptomyces sp. G-G2 TaxID=3046201 RepID=UPI0024B925DF|nr:non-ribosomal peptide synthetase [Streptomyces sp. G-G2]MDJ0384757.1 amino acid adenylation domain-containing protein [Streptomyces sp. G-G2]